MRSSELIVGLTVAFFLAAPAPSRGDAARDAAKAAVRAEVSAYGERAAAVAQQIWEYAELGYQEERSSKLLQTELARFHGQEEDSGAENDINDSGAVFSNAMENNINGEIYH